MFLPSEIDLGQPEKYILSIRIKEDSFMFSIHEPNNKKNYCLRETLLSKDMPLLESIKRIIFDFNFLTQEFSQTNVIIVSPEYTIIPNEYFQEKGKESLYTFTDSHAVETILQSKNENQDSTTLFNLNSELYGFLIRSLHNPIFFHHSCLLVKMLENKEKTVNLRPRIILNFLDNQLDILCFSQSKLQYCQTYYNESGANQAYYILKLWEKCGLDQMNDMLFIAGVAPDIQVYKIIKQYIKNIKVASAPIEIHLWNDDASKAPLDLLALSL